MRERRILLVSTDPLLIKAVQGSSADTQGAPVTVCAALAEARCQLEEESLGLALIHVTPKDAEADTEQFIRAAAVRHCNTVVLSDEYRDQQAVGFLRAGAADYLGLPVDLGRLGYLLEVLTVRPRPLAPSPPAPLPPGERGENQSPLSPGGRGVGGEGGQFAAGHLLGPDAAYFVLDPDLVQMMDHLRRVVAKDTTLLFTGETGTGKTRLARLIHELSPRRDEPFLVVDCGALSASLIESEMFGHVKGAYTSADRDRTGKFAAAAGGTLLLDEVNSLPLALQSKLLRTVDERVFEPVGSNKTLPFRARLIVASNTPLEQEVAAGRFRADLYFRLNVVGFSLTPLRQRQAAVPLLANRFLAEFTARTNRDLRRIAPEAMRLLGQYHWPGNIRELRNVIERAVALCPGTQIQVADLPEAIRAARTPPAPRPLLRSTSSPARARTSSLVQSREEVEVLRITEALQKHGNNRLRAAAELGISRMALYKKLHKYGLMGTA